jgi:hypothetical protein
LIQCTGFGCEEGSFLGRIQKVFYIVCQKDITRSRWLIKYYISATKLIGELRTEHSAIFEEGDRLRGRLMLKLKHGIFTIYVANQLFACD